MVLRGLHADATAAGLGDLAGGVLPQVRQSLGTGDLRGTIQDIRDELAARDIVVMLVGTDGRLRPIGGVPTGDPIMASDGTTCACNRCPHMARNTLRAVRDCLKTGQPEIGWQPYFDKAQAVLQKSLLE